MARSCTDCRFTSNDPFVDRCPECGGYMAIGGRAEPASRTQSRRSRPDERDGSATSRSSRGLLVPGLVAVGALALGFLLIQNAGQAPPPAPEAGNGARIHIGMPVRDAALALEPEPDASRVVTLHDLVGPNAPPNGQFTWSNGRRTLSVSFRDGKVTSVHESAFNMPGGFEMELPVQVSISTDPVPDGKIAGQARAADEDNGVKP